MHKLVVAVFLIVVVAVFGAAIVKLMWWLCGMEAWLGLPLPWGPAFFISAVLSGSSVSKS